VAARPAPAAEDALLRRRIEALEAACEREGRWRDAAREALEASEGTADAAAGARALRFSARAALRAGEDSLALRACERLLDRWPDAADEGSYPYGPGAAAAACEVWKRRLESLAPGAPASFVDALLAWRRVLVRASFSPGVAAAEAAEVRRLAESEAPRLGEAERKSLEEGLAALDASDRGADGVRAEAVRAALREAAVEGRPRWVGAAGADDPLTFCVAPAAAGAAVAFQTDAQTLRGTVLAPLLEGFAVHEGVEVRLLDADRRPVDGRGAPPSARATLASLAIPLPTGAVFAEAILVDHAALDRDAARSRNFLLGVVAAAVAGLGIGSVLVLRMVRAEVRLAKMKADFVSAVSHDLKTPLTSIRMFLETLREGRARTEEERREYLDVVDREAGRLERMVHRVLEFSRVAAGVRGVVREPADPAEVVREAARIFRGHVLNGEFDFSVDVAPDIPMLPLDRDAMTQVLLNLLENAHKYSAATAKRVELRAAPTPAGGLRIEVEDNGPGVPPSEREKVFGEFYRVERPGTEGAGGTGLGLALVRRLVEAHGGTVRCEAGREGGARFVVEIPG
jgi:signal transduction histidine kinase